MSKFKGSEETRVIEVIGIDREAGKVLLADGVTECKIVGWEGDFAIIEHPAGNFAIFDASGPTMTMQ